MLNDRTRTTMRRDVPFLGAPGAWVLVDGQYGSTGKGLMAAAIAEAYGDQIDYVTTNAGPNSGHTSYVGDEKIVLKQLPTSSVVLGALGRKQPHTFLNAGAIIDRNTLLDEMALHGMGPNRISISPVAAVVDEKGLETEKNLTEAIGSTGKGTGAAIARKVMRDPEAVASAYPWGTYTNSLRSLNLNQRLQENKTVFVEVSQGYSLSLNAGGFYPYCTSRDCTVSAALSDANIHPSFYRGSAMVVRTYPIRVAGNSGPGFPDQQETDWTVLGQKPELTTVTQKVRRIFTWSRMQFAQAMIANRPGIILVNFMNYLADSSHEEWLKHNVVDVAFRAVGYNPIIMLGHGPKTENLEMYHG